MTKIKICGLTRIEDIEAANQFLPHYIGFVFAKSQRQVTFAQAKLLKEHLNKTIQAVGVFVNESIPFIVQLVEENIIDIIQLHGDETTDYIQQLKKLVTVPIIKAVRVQNANQILSAQKLPCDMLLLDTYKKGQYGGSGECFDYSIIPPLQKPFFIAGGIHQENVENVILQTQPYAVDMSSGVETNGLKDANKIEQIIKIISNISI